MYRMTSCPMYNQKYLLRLFNVNKRSTLTFHSIAYIYNVGEKKSKMLSSFLDTLIVVYFRMYTKMNIIRCVNVAHYHLSSLFNLHSCKFASYNFIFNIKIHSRKNKLALHSIYIQLFRYQKHRKYDI